MISGQSLPTSQGILPDGPHLALFGATGGELQRICRLPFSSLDRFATNAEGCVASISGTGTPRLECWNANARAALVLSLPNAHYPDAVAFGEQILYVGGCTEENLPFLGLYDLGTQSMQWMPIQVPREVVGWGKSVDALLIDGPRLIVFDNIVVPSWVLVYDISELLQPKLSAVQELETHGTYEVVRGASAGHRWIAVMTATTSGWSGPAQHIALLDKSSLKEQAVISARASDRLENHYDDWSDIVLWDDLLLVAAGRDGIGVLDLSKIDDLKVSSELCRKEFYCISLPSFRDEKVLRVVPAPFADCLGVVLERDSSIRSQLLRRQDLLDIQNDARRVPFEEIYREPF